VDKSLENWLRGGPAPAEPSSSGAPGGMDQAALLGLPVAPLGSGRPDEVPPEAEARIPPPSVTPEEQELIISEDTEDTEEEKAEEPLLYDDPAGHESFVIPSGEEALLPPPDLILEEEVIYRAPPKASPPVPRLFPDRKRPFMGARAKKFAAAGVVTAAAIAAGSWLLMGRESAGDLLVKGRELSVAGDYEEALEYYARAAEKDPAMTEALLGLADALERLDRKGEAVDAYYRCLQISRDDPAVHERLGFLFLSMSSYENALRSFHESIAGNPSDGRVFAGMGQAYEAREDYSQAVSAYKKALDLGPSSEENEAALKRAEEKLSAQNEEAERRQRDILAKENVLRGRSALDLGDYEDSRNSFLRALGFVPADHDALMGLGDLNRAGGNLEAAAEYYRAALLFHPDSPLASGALERVEKDLAALLPEEDVPLTKEEDEAKVAEIRQADAGSPDPKLPAKATPTAEEAPRKPDAPAPLVPSGRAKVTSSVRPVQEGPKPSVKAKSPPRPAAVSRPPRPRPASPPDTGMDHLSRGNYPAAFSHFWSEMLTPAAERPSGGTVRSPSLKNAPFSEGRWRDITPVSEGPLGGNLPLAVTLPDSGTASSRWTREKAPLIEAIRINPEDRGAYLNVAMSYLLKKKEDEKKVGHPASAEEEKAVWFSMLAHAWMKKGERDKAAIFLNAAKLRAGDEVLEQVLSLEKTFMGKRGREI
jgi:tetratricopeptide (TPR) repeat protein